MMMTLRTTLLISALAALPLAGCESTAFLNEAGAEVDEGGFGNPTMMNGLAMMDASAATAALGRRFDAEVPTTINFEFNKSTITPAAAAILNRQASWIRQFPEVRFRVYGHTDLVGSNAYNYALGLRRANAVVAYLSSQGISRSRLEALVSFGETRPVIHTQSPEERNRRTVTEVSGFAKGYAGLLNGKYAEVIFREYVKGAVPPIPGGSGGTSDVAAAVNPANAGGG